MNNNIHNVTPHFPQNISFSMLGIPPCRVGFFCARAKGVRGMSAPKIATSHPKKSYNLMNPTNLSLDKHLWGAWGVAATSKNNTTTK